MPLIHYPPNHKKAEKYVESVEYGMASCGFPVGLASGECPDVDPGCVSVCVSLIHLLCRPVAVCQLVLLTMMLTTMVTTMTMMTTITTMTPNMVMLRMMI